jgi:hypothetical protein
MRIKRLLPIILLSFLELLIGSCGEHKIEGTSYCETNTSPLLGKYYKNSKNVDIEYIEIINDSLYKYFYHDWKTKDSCTSYYEFSGRKFINGKLQCEIVFHDFHFFYKHLQSGDLSEIKDSVYTFYCPYTVTDSIAKIISNPFANFGQFELLLKK